MTIHGAKGLEFDHVFVVGVGLRGRADDPRLLNWLEMPREQGGDHLVMAPIRFRADEEDAGDDAINLYLKQLHRERARAERARQAYVALTRARRSLHLFVHPRVKETDGVLDFGADANSLLHNLWPAIGADAASYHALGGDDSGDDAGRPRPWPPSTRQRLQRRPAPLEPPAGVQAQGEILPSIAEQDEIEFSWARQTARRVGTVVHEALERFGREGPPSADELPRMRTRLESRLQALGIETQAAKDGAEFALKALHATLADTRGRWLFDPGHTQAAVGAGALGRAGRRHHQRGDRSHVCRRGWHALGGGFQDQSARRRRSGELPR